VPRLASLINENGSFWVPSNDPVSYLWKLTRIGKLFYLYLFGNSAWKISLSGVMSRLFKSVKE